MTIKIINVGNVVNDGSGDDLRTAFVKVNDNFALLNGQGENNTASNVGTGVGIFKEKVGVDLKFKSLIAGIGISLASNENTITINNSEDGLINQINTQLNSLLSTYNFGSITGQSNNVIDFILQSITIDFGTITAPGSLSIDGGSLV